MSEYEKRLDQILQANGCREKFAAAEAEVNQIFDSTFGFTIGDLLEKHEAQQHRRRARIEYVSDFYQRFPQCVSAGKDAVKEAYILYLYDEATGWQFSKAWKVSEQKVPISMMAEVHQLANLDYIITFM